MSKIAQVIINTGLTVVVSARGWKKNFPDLNQGAETTSLLRQETLLTQWADFLIIRESQPWAHGCVCFYSPETKEYEEWSWYTPVDLLIGWGRTFGYTSSLVGEEWGPRIHLLVGWEHMLPLGGG